MVPKREGEDPIFSQLRSYWRRSNCGDVEARQRGSRGTPPGASVEGRGPDRTTQHRPSPLLSRSDHQANDGSNNTEFEFPDGDGDCVHGDGPSDPASESDAETVTNQTVPWAQLRRAPSLSREAIETSTVVLRRSPTVLEHRSSRSQGEASKQQR